MLVKKSLACAILITGLTTSPSDAATYTSTVGEANFSGNLGTIEFIFVIGSNEVITSATVAGTYGNSYSDVYGNSGRYELIGDDDYLGECSIVHCPSGHEIPFSYAIPSLDDLLDGRYFLQMRRLDLGTVDLRIGDTTLTIYTQVSSVPIPAALPLLATGLGALGFIGWRRKRKTASAAA